MKGQLQPPQLLIYLYTSEVRGLIGLLGHSDIYSMSFQYQTSHGTDVMRVVPSSADDCSGSSTGDG